MGPRFAMVMLVSGFCAIAPLAGIADEQGPHRVHGAGGSMPAHTESPDTDALQKATISLSEYRFEPALTTLEAGKPAQLTLINNGKVVHEFATKALLDQAVDIKAKGILVETTGVEEVEIAPGSQVVLLFTPEKTGEFAIACHASKPEDHLKKGMAGKLVIK